MEQTNVKRRIQVKAFGDTSAPTDLREQDMALLRFDVLDIFQVDDQDFPQDIQRLWKLESRYRVALCVGLALMLKCLLFCSGSSLDKKILKVNLL